MTENYCKPLAEILRKAQGVIDENGKPVDIGGEVQQVRSICDRLAALKRAVIVREDNEVPEWAEEWEKRANGECVWVSGVHEVTGPICSVPAPDFRPDLEGHVTLPVVSLRTRHDEQEGSYGSQ